MRRDEEVLETVRGHEECFWTWDGTVGVEDIPFSCTRLKHGFGWCSLGYWNLDLNFSLELVGLWMIPNTS